MIELLKQIIKGLWWEIKDWFREAAILTLIASPVIIISLMIVYFYNK